MLDDIEKVMDNILKFFTDMFEKNFMFYWIIIGFILLMIVFILLIFVVIKGNPFAEPVIEVINGSVA